MLTGAALCSGVLVVNCPRATVQPVSDHAIGLIFALTRSIARQAALVASGVWDRAAAPTPIELEGLTIGLVGFGAIPRMILRKLQHFGVSFLVFDPMLTAEDVAAEAEGCAAPVTLLPTLAELCAASDIVSVHAPLVEATVGLVGEAEFRAMSPETLLINTARGPVVDEAALVAALSDPTHGPAAAGLDVVESEPLPPDHPLATAENVVLTPHIGGFSERMFEQFWQLSAESVVAMAAGQLPESFTNPEAANGSGFAAAERPAL